MNSYLKYFPRLPRLNQDPQELTRLSKEELIDILDKARTKGLIRLLLEHHIKASMYESALKYAETLQSWYELMETSHQLDSDTEKRHKKRKRDHAKQENSSGKSSKKDRKKSSKKDKRRNKRTESCKHCSGWHIAPDDDCWEKPGNSKPKSGTPDKGNDQSSKKRKYKEAVVGQFRRPLKRYWKAPRKPLVAIRK